MDDLRRIVQRLIQPIEFAKRDAYRHLPKVKNLGQYVSTQIVQALAQRIYPQHIETELLALRHLLADFDECPDQAGRQRRLRSAEAILAKLRGLEGNQEGPGAASDDMTSASSPVLADQDLWTIPMRFVKGVGPKRAALLERVGIKTVEDALWFLPWRYEDRSEIVPISRLVPGVSATICGTVVECVVKPTRRRNFTVTEVRIEDATGSLHAVFFNQRYLETLFQPSARVMLSGMVSHGGRGGSSVHMEGPQYEILGDEAESPLHVGRIVPIYHETKGLSSRIIRTIMNGLLAHYGGTIPEVLPEALRNRHRFLSSQRAMAEVHFPHARADRSALDRGMTPAHRRLAFEELFLLELALALRQRDVKEEPKDIRFNMATPLVAQLRNRLPFRLTDAQERVLREIGSDMASTSPMNRLVQGDVGCGKTIVAVHALVIACGSGYQAALMVPTEILAEQHYLNLRDLLQPLGINTVLLRGGGGAKARQALREAIAGGEAQLVIGTHALIQKDVQFARLGLVVIDEQHKFGVMQRVTLLQKGYRPDVLVMTATPIPRTLAMTVYGDLDVSVIDALPAGRRPIHTWLFDAPQRRRAYQILEDQVRAGRQAYIVYPLVEESEKTDLQAAIQAAERLQAKELHGITVGLLHGRMKTAEKEATMAAFKAGRVQVLVATTVIEVGVDVTNATVILIEHAERFGLAQLHQLRGRVGRGSQQSLCLLVTSRPMSRSSRALFDEPTSPSRQRLEALVKSTDGFVIAEEDLRIRGPGEFFGVRQWGVPEFRAADLIRDGILVEQARQEARMMLAADPALDHLEHRNARTAMIRRWKTKLELGTVS